jgi:hypothetical protein
MRKGMVNNIKKLYSNEERNGSTTYKIFIVMRKGMGQQHIKTI